LVKNQDIDTLKNGIYIGRDCWLGAGACILAGVQIGDGAVVGAMSVVTKNVEPYAVVVGNPAKQIKTRQ
ncbi:MAG: DapH/DapD/GlmU-related protein, partial [Nostoc sp.]